MHPEAKQFTLFVQSCFPAIFTNPVKVLDVGSGDINGNNRFLFHPESEYHGNDMVAAKNVTIVGKTSALPFPDGYFDVIVSTECFEHDPEYVESIRNIQRMLKPGGLFFFTCASTNRPEHGTRRTNPQDSYATLGKQELWQDYYKNLTIEDIDHSIFTHKAAYYHKTAFDLYFIGANTPIPEYNALNVVRTL
jgi:SAM-dependent methyltransferase